MYSQNILLKDRFMCLSTAKQYSSFQNDLIHSKQAIVDYILYVYNNQIKSCINLLLISCTSIQEKQDCLKLLLDILDRKKMHLDQINQVYHNYAINLAANNQIIIGCIKCLHTSPNSNTNFMDRDCKKIVDTRTATNGNINIDKLCLIGKADPDDKKKISSNAIKQEQEQENGSTKYKFKGLSYRTLFETIGDKLYRCKVCKDYQATTIHSITTHIRKKHKRKAYKAKYQFQLSKLESVPNFDFCILNKRKRKIKTRKRTYSTVIKGYWKCHKCDQIIHTKYSAILHAKNHETSINSNSNGNTIVKNENYNYNHTINVTNIFTSNANININGINDSYGLMISQLQDGMRNDISNCHDHDSTSISNCNDSNSNRSTVLKSCQRSNKKKISKVSKMSKMSNVSNLKDDKSGIKTEYKCGICDKYFSCRSALQSHLSIHTGDRRFQCHLCKHRFRLKTTLTNHIRCHTGEKPYKCHYKGCKKAYKTRTMLKEHLVSHTDEKPYVCKLKGCNKAYGTRSGLRHHLSIHAGTNKAQCQLCGKWMGKGAIASHLMNVHKTISHMRMECDICGRKLQNKWGLKIHKNNVHGIHTYLDWDEAPHS